MALEQFVADLSARRRQHLEGFSTAPQQRRWNRIDGGELSTADWEALATDGVVFAPQSANGAPTVTISRSMRKADIVWPSQNA